MLFGAIFCACGHMICEHKICETMQSPYKLLMLFCFHFIYLKLLAKALERIRKPHVFTKMTSSSDQSVGLAVLLLSFFKFHIFSSYDLVWAMYNGERLEVRIV